mmetsp:Transcript_107612/g.303038  ORF Transcript_107612/g.303038 Transcript_107612/m.303038 type:complete len:215 (+) Transcript_107612:330-974(+)
MASCARASAKRAAPKCWGWKAPANDQPSALSFTSALQTNNELLNAMRPAATTSAKLRRTSVGQLGALNRSGGNHGRALERSATRGGGVGRGGTSNVSCSVLRLANEAFDVASLNSGAHIDIVSLLSSDAPASVAPVDERTSSKSSCVEMEAVDTFFCSDWLRSTRSSGTRPMSSWDTASPRIAVGGAEEFRLRGCWSRRASEDEGISTNVFLTI